MFNKASLVISLVFFGSFSLYSNDKWIELEEKICMFERCYAFDQIRDNYSDQELRDQKLKLNVLNLLSKNFYRNIPAITDQEGQENSYKTLCYIGGLLEHENEWIEKFLNDVKLRIYNYPDNKKWTLIESLRRISNDIKKKQQWIIDEISIDKFGNSPLKYNYITPSFREDFLNEVENQNFNAPTNLQNTHFYEKRKAQATFITRVNGS